MRVFVTGASGWIGSAVVDDLLAAGHEVTGLVRSDAAAEAVSAKGARVRRGDLDDLAGIRSGTQEAEAVVHLADALAGSGRPFLLAWGVAALANGRPATEADPSPFHGPDSPRGGAENLALEYVERGVHTVSLRFSPTVHGTRDHGFIAVLTEVARRTGVAGYPGDGTNGWAAVHRSDAARLVTLSLAQAPAGARLHAVAETAVPTREIAEAIGRALDLPVKSVDPDQVQAHFGWIGTFFAMDLTATSAATRELLGWTPTGPTLIEDIDNGAYTTA
jgi:nucleoside-diphosphate-sugar epimerase